MRDGENCHWCGRLLEFSHSKYIRDLPPGKPIPGRKEPEACYRATVDHVIPRSNDGPNELDNLVLSCQPCNSCRTSPRGKKDKWKRYLNQLPRVQIHPDVQMIVYGEVFSETDSR